MTSDPSGSASERPSLAPHHDRLIVESGISPEVARERGYRTVTKKTEVRVLGFKESQCLVPGLLIPVFGVAGEIVNYQLRPDSPRIVKGKALKYETPGGSHMALDVPPRWARREILEDPKLPLFITEGARKADAGASIGLFVIALLGVWNWRGTTEHYGSAMLPDWESITLKGRTIYVVFDSDIVAKSAVRKAMIRLRAVLQQRGATVFIIYLPSGEGGTKVGLDDFLASGKTRDDLLALAESEVRPLANPESEGSTPPYFISGGKTFWARPTEGSVVPFELANFAATIVRELRIDNGIESSTEFELEVQVGSATQLVRVPARMYATMAWTSDLGARAIVAPSMGVPSHLRVAIQHLSPEVELHTIYAHTGWREIPGHGAVYLHAGGAIGTNGTIPGIEVQLPQGLAGATLPEPPSAEALRLAIAELDCILRLGGPKLAFACLAAPFRAALGSTDYSLMLVGPTGSFKTETATIVQSFFGRGFNSRELPSGFSSTANATEVLAFVAKDMLIVVDDFVQGGSRQQVERQQAHAERIFRAQGNRNGRDRLTADLRLRGGMPPRGMLLATAEERVARHSAMARLLLIEAEPGDIDVAVLTLCQKLVASGTPSLVMAAFLTWIAPQLEQVQAQLIQRATELRALLVSRGWHGRTQSAIADLMAGFELYLAFCEAKTASAPDDAQARRFACWAALTELGDAQSDEQSSVEPATLFVRLTRSALASGAAHVASSEGRAPGEHAQALGWRAAPSAAEGAENPTLMPMGACIGWKTDEGVFLDPDAALKVAQAQAGDGERIPTSANTLGKRLRQRGLLASDGRARGRVLVRRVLNQVRRDVLHFSAETFIESSHSSHEVGDWPPGTTGADPGDECASIAAPAVADASTAPPLPGPWLLPSSAPTRVDADALASAATEALFEGREDGGAHYA